MKLRRTGALLSLTIMLALLIMAIPASPALAAVGVISMTPTVGPVNTVVSITGTGFTLGGTYTVYFDAITVVMGTVVGGNFSTSFTVPPSTTVVGHTIRATTSGGDTSNTLTFTVMPQVILSSASGNVGDTITITGYGFAASQNVNIFYDGTYVTTTPSNTVGSFGIGFAIPAGSGVNHTVTATDALGNSAAAGFTIISSVTISPASASPGAQFSINGIGYGAGQTVTIYVDSAVITSTTVSATGTFSLNLTVPQGVTGSHTLTATDALGNTASQLYTVVPAVNISPSSFTAGSQVTVNGAGFAASSVVAFYIDGVVVNASAATTNSIGSFSTAFGIPALPGGTHTFQSRDASNNSATMNFSLVPAVTINPQSGASGINVQVTANSFKANASITISFDGVVVAAPATDAGGSFSASFIVPAGAGGSHPVVVSDGTLSASTSFNIVASASISTVRGQVGTSTTVSGVSFNANSSIIVTYDDRPVATVLSDSGGKFSAPFNVPPSAAGNHNVKVTDGTRTMPFTFSVVPAITLNPASGYVDSSITIIGTGFVSGSAVSVKYDATQVATATADTNGGFAATFKAPISPGGNRTITVSDGTNTLTATFAMDSTPPPVSILASPANNTQADAMTSFEWATVTDPSGVAYTLQVARDPNFSTLVLEKKGLTSAGYKLTEQEKLESVSQQQPYYWRVKAVDSAANESAWTSSQTFYVGFVLATWGLYTILGAAVVIAGVLGFLLGIRKHRI